METYITPSQGEGELTMGQKLAKLALPYLQLQPSIHTYSLNVTESMSIPLIHTAQRATSNAV